jgi:hypothetical protein
MILLLMYMENQIVYQSGFFRVQKQKLVLKKYTPNFFILIQLVEK